MASLLSWAPPLRLEHSDSNFNLAYFSNLLCQNTSPAQRDSVRQNFAMFCNQASQTLSIASLESGAYCVSLLDQSGRLSRKKVIKI